LSFGLSKEIWEAVVEAGVEARLFLVDRRALSYPIIVPLDEPEPEPEPEAKDIPSHMEDLFPAPPPPEDWTPPTYMRCGHMTWWMQADEEGNEHCEACKRKYPPHWPSLKGKFVRPMPESFRLTVEKAKAGGFPGYCSDVNGYYIGGPLHDCRNESKNRKDWCEYHRNKNRG